MAKGGVAVAVAVAVAVTGADLVAVGRQIKIVNSYNQL